MIVVEQYSHLPGQLFLFQSLLMYLPGNQRIDYGSASHACCNLGVAMEMVPEEFLNFLRLVYQPILDLGRQSLTVSCATHNMSSISDRRPLYFVKGLERSIFENNVLISQTHTRHPSS